VFAREIKSFIRYDDFEKSNNFFPSNKAFISALLFAVE
jgi:hypothetical protein